jgi:hypothetical protein
MITGTASGGDVSHAVVLLCISNQPRVDTGAASCIILPITGSDYIIAGPSARALERSGFNAGETAYVAIYPLGWHEDAYSAYFDPESSKFVYSALGQRSQVLTVQIP